MVVFKYISYIFSVLLTFAIVMYFCIVLRCVFCYCYFIIFHFYFLLHYLLTLKVTVNIFCSGRQILVVDAVTHLKPCIL